MKIKELNSGLDWKKDTAIQPISWSEIYNLVPTQRPSFPHSVSPSPSEELFPCEQQRALQSSPLQPAGQRLLQQAAVDHLSTAGHCPVAGPDGSNQPVPVLPSPWSRPVSHSWSQPQLGHRNGRPHQSLTVRLIIRRPGEYLYICTLTLEKRKDGQWKKIVFRHAYQFLCGKHYFHAFSEGLCDCDCVPCILGAVLLNVNLQCEIFSLFLLLLFCFF